MVYFVSNFNLIVYDKMGCGCSPQGIFTFLTYKIMALVHILNKIVYNDEVFKANAHNSRTFQGFRMQKINQFSNWVNEMKIYGAE